VITSDASAHELDSLCNALHEAHSKIEALENELLAHWKKSVARDLIKTVCVAEVGHRASSDRNTLTMKATLKKCKQQGPRGSGLKNVMTYWT